MRYEDLTEDLKDVAFDFFYWFSRFEFALKENPDFRKGRPGNKVEPDWDSFEKKYKDNYVPKDEASQLVTLRPKCQKIDDNNNPHWVNVGLAHCANNKLGQVITCLKTVRNNHVSWGKTWRSGTR